MRSRIDTAVIMAGGLGMRLRPYTTVLPKPIMPLSGMPLLEILVRQLGAAGIRTVLVSVNHLSHIIKAVLDNTDFESIGVRVEYFQEDQPLGTCGSLTLMRARLPERFLVVNGDLLSDYPIGELLDQHAAGGALMTIASRIRSKTIDFGVIQRNEDGAMQDYIEKPKQQHELSIGLYAMERDCIDCHLKIGARTDMPELIKTLLANGEPVQAIPAECMWIDIGHADQYQLAQELFESTPEIFIQSR